MALCAAGARVDAGRRHDGRRGGLGGPYDLSGGIPSADYVTLAVTGAGSAASGTVYMFYDRHRA